MVNAALAEMNVSRTTLEGLGKEKAGAQLFVPIGGGSYAKAKLETTKNVVVGIGADVAVEKTIKEARADLETRIAELENSRNALAQQFDQVVCRIRDNRIKMEEISAKLREGEKQSGVRQATKGS
jgi:prefoldin alpha subunit